MKIRLSKITSIILLFAIIISCFVIDYNKAFATENVYQFGDYRYTIDESGNATITNYNINITGSVIIPNNLEGYAVKYIGDSAFNLCKLSDLVLPDSILSIGCSSFAYCTNLKTVKLGNNLQSIGESAFAGCSALKEIDVPESVVKIGKSAFEDCTSLYNAVVNSKIIERNTFSGCTNLSSLTFGNTVETVIQGAFNSFDTDKLKSVTIGKNVKQLNYAFDAAVNIESIVLDPQNTSYKFIDKILYNYEMTEIVFICANNGITEYTMPDSIEKILTSSIYNLYDCSWIYIGKSYGNYSQNDLTTLIDNHFFIDFINDVNAPTDISKLLFENTYKETFGSDWKKHYSKYLVSFPVSLISIGGKLSEDNPFFKIIENNNCFYLFDNSQTSLYVAVSKSESSSQFIVPCGVEYVGNVSTLARTWNIPASVKTISPFVSINYDATEYSVSDVIYYGDELSWNDITIENYQQQNAFKESNIIFDSKSAASHTLTSTETKKATCTEFGLITYTCTCGSSFCKESSKLSHSAGEWEIISKPTETEHGIALKKCIMCGETMEQKITPAFGRTPFKDGTIKTPTRTKIGYGDSIVLHIDTKLVPEDGYVVWEASNDNFIISTSDDGTSCKFTSADSTISSTYIEYTTVKATIYDKEGRPVCADEQVLDANVSIFQFFLGLIKKWFGLTKTYDEII